jgi:hypothetical protein
MRRTALALLAAGCVSFAGARALLADDPAPPAALSHEEEARVKQLIDNLGSDDFRIREGATKELTEMGARIRPQLEAASKSTVAEVRFRADQVLRKLDGVRRDRRIGEDDPAAPRPPAWTGGGRGFSNDDYARLMRQLEERMKQLEEETSKGFGQGGFRFDPNLFPGGLGGFGLQGLRPNHFHADSADLRVTRRLATLTLSEKAPDGSAVTVTYEAKNVDTLLAAHPELRDKPGVASVVEQSKKPAPERPTLWGGLGGMTLPPGGSFQMSVNDLSVRVVPGHATVTLKETGPDGKPVEKTYEGKDLDEIKRDHPELADRLGGFVFRMNGPVVVPAPGAKDDDGEDDDDEADAAKPVPTGPFGLALGRLDEPTRAKANLAEGAGLVVRAVRKGSDAEAAGLQEGDVVTAVDGAAVRAEVGIAEVVQAGRAKGSLTFEVLRGGKALTLTWKK